MRVLDHATLINKEPRGSIKNQENQKSEVTKPQAQNSEGTPSPILDKSLAKAEKPPKFVSLICGLKFTLLLDGNFPECILCSPSFKTKKGFGLWEKA